MGLKSPIWAAGKEFQHWFAGWPGVEAVYGGVGGECKMSVDKHKLWACLKKILDTILCICFFFLDNKIN